MKSGEHNKFVFVTPMYNASKTLSQLLLSIAAQSYKKWEIILIDDVSSKDDVQASNYIIDSFNKLFDHRFEKQLKVHWNEEKKWEVSNVLLGVSMCQDEDVICRIDGDDYLTDNDALAILNAVYTQTKADALWTAHRWNLSDKNISGPMPENADPHVYPWVSSHLKTFRKGLLNNVPVDNFKNQHGEIVRRAGDQAIYLPCLHNAKVRGYVPRVMYSYTIDEKGGSVYQSDDAKFQKSEADFIRSRGYVKDGQPWEDALGLRRS